MKIRIEQDEHYESPREWDNLGKMVCFHRRYDLGDKHEYSHGDCANWHEMEALIKKEEDVVVLLPLYLLDHSGITISCGSQHFRACDPQGWDWGQVGFIFATREDVLKEYSKKRISPKMRAQVEGVLRNEVKAYDQCLTGDVWGYIIEDDDGEHLDSCWGFYGHDYCEKEANDMVAFLKKQAEESAAELRRVQSAMPCCQP